MCFQENLTNAIFYVILYHFMRDFFFVSRSIVSFKVTSWAQGGLVRKTDFVNFNSIFKYFYTYFPISQFPILLGCSLLPILISTYLISLFYSIIIGDGNVYEADWVPVSIGFAVACAILLAFVPYNLFLGKQLLKTSKMQESNDGPDANDDEKQPAGTDQQATETKPSEHTEL